MTDTFLRSEQSSHLDAVLTSHKIPPPCLIVGLFFCLLSGGGGPRSSLDVRAPGPPPIPTRSHRSRLSHRCVPSPLLPVLLSPVTEVSSVILHYALKKKLTFHKPFLMDSWSWQLFNGYSSLLIQVAYHEPMVFITICNDYVSR